MTSLTKQLKSGGMVKGYAEVSKAADERPKDGEKIYELDNKKIDQNPFQYRINVDPEKVQVLAERIAKTGQLQPIGVRKFGDRYQIIWGEHRWRACVLIGAKVKAVIREANDSDMANLCFSENNDRTAPSAYENYNAILIQKNMGKSAKEIQEDLGLRPQDYYKLMAFEHFPKEVIEVITASKENIAAIGKTEAEALSKYFKPEDADRKKVSDIIIEGIERLANKNVKTRKEMLAFIEKSLRPARQPSTNKKPEAVIQSQDLVFDGKPVGTLKVNDSALTLVVSKEDLPMDKYLEFQKYVSEFFKIND